MSETALQNDDNKDAQNDDYQARLGVAGLFGGFGGAATGMGLLRVSTHYGYTPSTLTPSDALFIGAAITLGVISLLIAYTSVKQADDGDE
jgi:hypothetical protein